MPTPVAYQTGEINPFKNADEHNQSTRLQIFYATNRPAQGPLKNRSYNNGVSSILRFGLSTVKIGDADFTWKDLESISTGSHRDFDPKIYLEKSVELGLIGPDDTLNPTPASAKFFIDEINRQLENSESKNIFIFLNGANSSFYSSIALASQFGHFNGRDAITMAFSWPSEGNLLAYRKDVEHATESAPTFARFLEFIAENTNAEHLYILAYSAGAQVANQGLYALRNTYPGEDPEHLRKRMKISEVYFAAPDEDTHAFGTVHLPTYINMVDNVTVSLMYDDTVLKLAEWHHSQSRLGRPIKNQETFTGKERQWVVDAITNGKLDIIDMEFEAARPMSDINFGFHGNWYKNTWVISDILVQFYFHANPGQRGLTMDNMRFDFPTWFFSDLYPKNVQEAVRLLLQQPPPEMSKDDLPERHESELSGH